MSASGGGWDSFVSAMCCIYLLWSVLLFFFTYLCEHSNTFELLNKKLEKVSVCFCVSIILTCVVVVRTEQAICIVRGMKSASVMEPEPALFQVEINLKSGRPPKWTLNGEILEHCAGVNIDREGNIHSLCFTTTDSSMSGPVVFVAGKSRCTAQLTVKGEISRLPSI